jgi:hypothetical protein
VGLAVVFNIRSGIELAAAFAFYCLCIVRLRNGRPGRWGDVLAAGGGAVAMAAIGLALAGHGQIFSTGFWTGWLDEPLYYLMLPLATVPVPATIVRFGAVCLLYLTVIGYCVGRLILRRARHIDVFNGFVALYGLLVLIKFVHHSADMTFVRLLIPMVILGTSLAGQGLNRLVPSVRRAWGDSMRSRVVLGLPYALAGMAVLALIAAPRSPLVDQVLAYPSLLSDKVHGRQPDGLCLLADPKDICGLPAQLDSTVNEFREISGLLKELEAKGQNVAVLDETGSLFYLAGGVAPYGAFPRIFMTAYTKELRQEVVRGLEQNPPDYILTRTALQPGTPEYEPWAAFGPGPVPDSWYADTWDRLNAIVRRDYRLERSMVPFELWRRGGQAAAGSHS